LLAQRCLHSLALVQLCGRCCRQAFELGTGPHVLCDLVADGHDPIYLAVLVSEWRIEKRPIRVFRGTRPLPIQFEEDLVPHMGYPGLHDTAQPLCEFLTR
jgi:hypothetical protein